MAIVLTPSLILLACKLNQLMRAGTVAVPIGHVRAADGVSAPHQEIWPFTEVLDLQHQESVARLALQV
jgi:hypothetical protein